MVRLFEAGLERAADKAADRGGRAALDKAVSADGTAARSERLSPAGRRLATGSSSAATRAAIQTAWRCDAGPLRIMRQARAATAVTRGTCQSAFNKNVRKERLIVSM